VVATNISGIPELVHHEQTGLLVSQRDPEALFTAISRLYHDPSLRLQLGKGGREKVHQEFDLHHETARLYHLFTSLQDGHTPVVPAHRLFDTDRSS
jgi:glycosyltransferase involved in cell wall biosynthesis